jgi:chemotaxis-related protein WspD
MSREPGFAKEGGHTDGAADLAPGGDGEDRRANLAVRAQEFFDRSPPEGYLAEWSHRLILPEAQAADERQSVVVFRLGNERLAIETTSLVEVTPPQPVHAIPHRANAVLLGLVNIRGQLRICVSLHGLLGVEDAGPKAGTSEAERMMILQDAADQWVFPVEEVSGVHRLSSSGRREVPSTFGKGSSFSRSVFTWREATVGLLDHARLVAALRSACS